MEKVSRFQNMVYTRKYTKIAHGHRLSVLNTVKVFMHLPYNPW